MLKRKQHQRMTFFTLYRWQLSCIVSIISLIFVLGALSSYHATDQSLFYFSTDNPAIANLFGALGSHCAALLVYCLGAAAWLMIPFLTFVCMLLLFKRELRAELDRIAAALMSMSAVAGLFSYYKWDFLYPQCPGGLIGLQLHTLSIYLFNYAGIFFMYTLLLASMCILCNFVLVPMARLCWRILSYATDVQRVWVPMFNHTRSALIFICMSIYKAVQYFFYVISARIVYDNSQTIFENEYDQQDPCTLLHQLNQQQENTQVCDSAPTMPEKKEEVMSNPAPTADIPFEKKSPSAAVNDSAQPQQKENYALPSIDIFIGVAHEQDDKQLVQELEKKAHVLEEKLSRFGVQGSVTAIKRGPVVTVYEYQPDIDSKLSKIIALEDDLALALQALSIRILAPIPGRSVVGFEVANHKRKQVSFAKVVRSPAYQQTAHALPLLLGEDTIGSDVVVDLARMPHLLIAGSTGSGKSVALNGMLVSLLCKLTPGQLKLILIDPKRLEFSSYADIPHLLFPIITEPKKVAPVLRYVIEQMEERYERMAQVSARNIFDYHALAGNKESMPFMVIVIDELADLMMTAGREIEDLITRIAQMARAAGIHMLVATQRPSVDVITGLIKVNFPSRVSFRVTSKIDSRTILDATGAEKLVGRGDMLFLDSSSASIKRVHGAFVSDQEILSLVNHLKSQQKPEYVPIEFESYQADNELLDADDTLYQDVLQFLQTIDEISISLLQRRFRIGYNRSARIIELLESQGVILPSQGGKTRKIVR